jgi:rubredoxin---NAD+ reductase
MAPIIVVGAGLAGWTVVREFRKLDTTTPITLVTADNGDFYAKPSLSNAFAQGKNPAQLVNTSADKMASTLNVTLLAHTQVLAIQREASSLLVQPPGDAAKVERTYSRLVLATGAKPIRVPVAGNAAHQVISVNSLDDFAVLHGLLQGRKPGLGEEIIDCPREISVSSSTFNSDPPKPMSGKRIVIMGGGLIGCEFANDLAGAGFTVSVVDPGPRPLALLLPEAAGLQLQTALAALGVQWHWGTTVQSVNVAEAPARALQVTLANGVELPADVVISAVGLRADTHLAHAASIHCERGICVDENLQTSVPHIYALGDAAQYAHGRTLPYVMPIMAAAKSLAAALAGQSLPLHFGIMPVAIKTPALPLVISPPVPGQEGQWVSPQDGIWQFVDDSGKPRGFALAGSQTAKRGEQVKALAG